MSYKFEYDLEMYGKIHISKIDTEEQITYILTKPLCRI